MKEILLVGSSVIDWSAIFEHGLVGVLVVAFALKFAAPLLASLINTNEKNADSKVDIAVSLNSLKETVSRNHREMMNLLQELREENQNLREELKEAKNNSS